jgi:hypothetical protein
MERNRPKAAAEFAVQNSSGETRENLIAAISYQWAQTNPAAALAWTQDLSDPGRAGCDSAGHGFGGCGGQSVCHGGDDIASFW